jgi:hypothetical protein
VDLSWSAGAGATWCINYSTVDGASHAPASGHGERFESAGLMPAGAMRTHPRPFSVGAGLISRRLQLGNAILQYRVREVGKAVLDRVAGLTGSGRQVKSLTASCSSDLTAER